jgi:hypothetical protein
MRKLLFGLKEYEKELCNAKPFSVSKNLARRDRALPLFNGYYKQSTPPKATSHAKSLQNSLNKTKNICRIDANYSILSMTPPRMHRWTPCGPSSSNLGKVNLSLGIAQKYSFSLVLDSRILTKSPSSGGL